MNTKKFIIYLMLFVFTLTGCTASPIDAEPESQGSVTFTPFGPAASTDTPEPTATVITPTATEVPPTSTPEPTVDPALLNPLTGLAVEDASLLERRPILVKVENLPRNSRPQFGLSFADHVYEYHTEEGTTRFAAIYYGQNSEMVGPIRSGRIFDIQLVSMYKANFVFSGAYYKVLDEFAKYPLVYREFVESSFTYPAMYRYEPSTSNYLMVNLDLMPQIIANYGIDNSRQDLSGFTFDRNVPEGGLEGEQVFVRFSAAIYNRWDYDELSNGYLRFSETENDVSYNNEVYAPLTDRITGEQLMADNLVIIFAPNIVFDKGIYDILLTGTGTAFVFRDGKAYELVWNRPDLNSMIQLMDEFGNPFPLKPGNVWFEVMSVPTPYEQNENMWRFTFQLP